MRAYLTLRTAVSDALELARPDALILDAGAAHPGFADVPVFLRLGAVEAPGFANALRAATPFPRDSVGRSDTGDASPRPLGEGDHAQPGGVDWHTGHDGAAPSDRFAATSPTGGGEGRGRPRRSSGTGIRPAAILLPVRHGRDIAHAGAVLAVHEAEQGWPDGATRIVALVASAAGAMNLASLAGASPRLSGIGWDAAALAEELGCGSLDATGTWTPPLAQVRALVRLAAAAAAAGVEAIEAACPPDADAASHAATARRDGFDAVFAETAEAIAAIRSAGAGV